MGINWEKRLAREKDWKPSLIPSYCEEEGIRTPRPFRSNGFQGTVRFSHCHSSR